MASLKTYILGFISGIIISQFVIFYFNDMELRSFVSPNASIQKMDPYQWDDKTKSSLSYHFLSLPVIIQNEIKKLDPEFDFFTSCHGDVRPGGAPDYAVAYQSQNKTKIFVFEMENETTIKAIHDISDEIKSKPTGTDYLEIQCRHGTYPISQGNFRLRPEKNALAADFQKSNREILRIKSRQSRTYGFFAYNFKDSHYHFIGTLPAE